MKKKQVKGLRELSQHLPESKVIVKYSIVKKGWELSVEELDKCDFDVEAEKLYIQKGHYKIEDVNHLNRLKKAFAKNKEQGIVDYIQWVDTNNRKMNELFKNLELERVKNELMQLKADGFWSQLISFLFAFLAVFKIGKSKAH